MDPNDFLKNFKDIQSKLDITQEKLKNFRADGEAGGGLVKIVIDGTMEMRSLAIDPVAVDPRDVQMLEELIVAAFTSASRKMKQIMQQEMSQITRDMDFNHGTD